MIIYFIANGETHCAEMCGLSEGIHRAVWLLTHATNLGNEITLVTKKIFIYICTTLDDTKTHMWSICLSWWRVISLFVYLLPIVYHCLSTLFIICNCLSLLVTVSWLIMGYHGLSWVIMGYHGLSWVISIIMAYHGL